jgi:hypothetical protein
VTANNAIPFLELVTLHEELKEELCTIVAGDPARLLRKVEQTMEYK